MTPSHLRYEQIRVADAQNDQETAVQIATGGVPGAITTVTQEDLQQLFLSQMKRIIFGNIAGHWYADFESQGISSLYEKAIDFLLDNDPVAEGTTYTPVYLGSRVIQERWTITATVLDLKRVTYTYAGNRVTQTVVQVFGVDGLTVIGQTTTNYTYLSSRVAHGVTTRDV